MMSFQKLVIISELYVLISKIPNSTELFQVSWLKEVTLPSETVLVVNPSMELNLLMKTSLRNMLVKVFCQWPTLAQTQTDLNSSYVSLIAHG
ncbi:UNVERIFIED_CONTAM: hypothetical protein GTU68_032807 [Idotea baltica]|nr:hypothetical protein [Idotea baltica]